MGSFTDNMTDKEWEKFCEVMLRYHYGQRYFWIVPDDDGGDYGIEFYAADGTIYQCYYPDPLADMPSYKKKIQKKINEDLKKLKEYEAEISQMLDGKIIKQWVLLTPRNRSKSLIAYCNKKKNETLARDISYIDKENFQVKIETADTFPDAQLYAKGVYLNLIDIPISEVSEFDRENWKQANGDFSNNIERKSRALIKGNSDNFQDRIVTKYIQINKFLDQLRDDHPDLYDRIEGSAQAQLENMQDDSTLEANIDRDFIRKIVNSNNAAFVKYKDLLSDRSSQPLSYGYLSKWIAECYMDFVDE